MKTSPNPGSEPRILLLRFGVATVAAGLTFAAASPWLNHLGFDPAAIARGEVWRFLTGHVAHLSWPHTVANAVGVGLSIAVILDLAKPRTVCASLLLIAAGIGAVHMLVDFRFGNQFAGFSGILYGLAALIACLLWATSKAWAAGIALALIASIAFSLSGWNPWGFEMATATHVCGVAFGAAAGAWLRIQRRGLR